MNKKYNWLELAEFFSIGAFFFGVISTAITKEILFSLIPLIFVIFFNIINRQRHSYQKDKILEQQQQIHDLQQQLVSFTDEYKTQNLGVENLRDDVNNQRLELEKVIEDANQQRLLAENKNKEYIDKITEKVKKEILELENKTNEYLANTDIDSLLTQLNNLQSHGDKLSNYVDSELNKFRQSLDNLQSKSNQYLQIKTIIDSLESRIENIENIKVEETKQQILADYHVQKLELIKLIEENKVQVFDGYNAQKLELEKVIEEANQQRLLQENQNKEYINKLIEEIQKQILELENKSNQGLKNGEINSLLTELNNLKLEQNKIYNYVESALDKFKESLADLQRQNNQFSQIETTIKNLESLFKQREKDENDSESDFNNNYQSSVGESSNFKGLTEFYPLQGLTEKLINEIKNSDYIEDSEDNKIKKLDNYAMESLKATADSCEELARIVTRYYYDNQCRQEEAHQLDFELRQLASILRQCNSVYDLELIYQVIELFTFQISRFKHNKTYYCWDNLMRKNIISKLDKYKLNKDKNNSYKRKNKDKNNNYNRKKKDKFNEDMEKLTKGLEEFCQGWGNWGK